MTRAKCQAKLYIATTYDIRDRVKEIAQEKGISVNKLLTTIIEEYAEGEKFRTYDGGVNEEDNTSCNL